MSKAILRPLLTIIGTAVGFAIGGPFGAAIGSFLGTLAGTLLVPIGAQRRQAQETTLSLGEHPRTVLFGEAATGGGLLDAFNFGGKYGTDWEVIMVALADHECESLEGFYVNDEYVAFAGDGVVSGYNSQLEVYWLPGTETQTWPSIVTTYGGGWTNDDNCKGVSVAVAAYKADKADAKNPIWTGGRPRFLWVLKGKKCYRPSLDSTVDGGSGSHRWDDPATWEWTDNAADCRYNYQRGIFALDRVDQPEQLLLGRGLSEIEAPPERCIAWSNLCDEDVALKAGGTVKRYTINGTIGSEETFLDAEEKFAAAMAGIIVQPNGSIDVEPGHAKSVVAEITDDDILNLETVTISHYRSEADRQWSNMVVPRYVEPEQKWKLHAAPIRRDYLDVIADGGPRDTPLPLDLVTNNATAQRIGEITRRMGRLTKTAALALPPRYVGLEEGDWIGWTSDRYLDGARIVFRIDAFRRSEKWHMFLNLREISSSVFSWTAATDELDDGAQVVTQTPPPAIGAPDGGAWTLTGGSVSLGTDSQPALIIAGAVDDDYAQAIRFEYRIDGDTDWIDAGLHARDTTSRTITGVQPNTDYEAAVSYIVGDEPGDRLILGPETTGGLSAESVGAYDEVALDTIANAVTSLEDEGWIEAGRLSSDFTTTSTSAVDVTGLAFTPDASSEYEFIIDAGLRTSDAAQRPRLGLAWPTGLTDGWGNGRIATSAAAAVAFNGNPGGSMLSQTGTFPNTTQSWRGEIIGSIVVGASPSGTLKVQLASSNASATATMKAGSSLRYRKKP